MKRRNHIADHLTVIRLNVFAQLGVLTILCGCGSSCFIFVSNPSQGTIAFSNSTCSANGIVKVQFASFPLPGVLRSRVQHLYVSLRSIEAHPTTTNGGDDSSDWEELAPDLVTQPVQVDLMEPKGTSQLSEAAVPAGPYSQVRMLLVSNHPAAEEPAPKDNVCGDAGFNCLVRADGEIRPLTLIDGGLQVHISPQHIAGGFFSVLPETRTNLLLEFNPYQSLASPVNDSVRLDLVFSASADTSADTAEQIDRHSQ